MAVAGLLCPAAENARYLQAQDSDDVPGKVGHGHYRYICTHI